MKHFFIVTFARTGSTALLKVLNSLDGACIRGQNGGLLHQLVDASETLRLTQRVQQNKPSGGSGSPWYGIQAATSDAFSRSLADSFSRDVLTPPPGTRISGFKETRYTDEIVPDRAFDAMMRFMLKNFETPRIIFLTRDPREASQSGSWQERDRDVVIDVLDMTVERFHRAHAAHPNRSFLLDHSEFDRDSAGLRPLLDWLEEDLSDEALAEALQERLLHLN